MVRNGHMGMFTGNTKETNNGISYESVDFGKRGPSSPYSWWSGNVTFYRPLLPDRKK